MGLLDQWNKNKFSIYKNEEKTVLKLLESISKWLEKIIIGLDGKTDLYGDHKGSWQGLNKPTLSEEGMRATVEKLNDETIPHINSQMEKNKNSIDMITYNIAYLEDYESFTENILINEVSYKCWDNALKQACLEVGWGKVIIKGGRHYFNKLIEVPENILIEGENMNISEFAATPVFTGELFVHLINKASGIYTLQINGNNVENLVGLKTEGEHTFKVHDLYFLYFKKSKAAILDGMNQDVKNIKFYQCKEIDIIGSDNAFSHFMFSTCVTAKLGGGNNRYYDMSYKGGEYHKDFDYTDTYGLVLTGSRNFYNTVEAQDAFWHGINLTYLERSFLNGVLADRNGRIKNYTELTPTIKGINIGKYCFDLIMESTSDNYTTPATQDIGIISDSTSSRLILTHKSFNQNKSDSIEQNGVVNNIQKVLYRNYNSGVEFTSQNIPITINPNDEIEIFYGTFGTEFILSTKIIRTFSNNAKLMLPTKDKPIFRDIKITSTKIEVGKAYTFNTEGTKIDADQRYLIPFLIRTRQSGVY